MTLPRTVADVLTRHVSFEIESIDRMYCNVYQPKLQYPGGAAGFFVGHRGFTYASSALMAQMTETYLADLYHFIAAADIPLVQFANDVPGHCSLIPVNYHAEQVALRVAEHHMVGAVGVIPRDPASAQGDEPLDLGQLLGRIGD